MCAGGIVQARVPWVVYGATDPKAGACHTLYQITNDPRLNHPRTGVGAGRRGAAGARGGAWGRRGWGE